MPVFRTISTKNTHLFLLHWCRNCGLESTPLGSLQTGRGNHIIPSLYITFWNQYTNMGEKLYGQRKWVKGAQRVYHDHKFVSATKEVELCGKSHEKERDSSAALLCHELSPDAPCLALPPQNPNFWNLTESHLFYYTRSETQLPSSGSLVGSGQVPKHDRRFYMPETNGEPNPGSSLRWTS
jgi:hypothetical protein